MDAKVIREIVIPCAKITWRDDDIIRYEMTEGHIITVNDIKGMTDLVGELGQGKKFYNLIIMPEFENVSFEVREYKAGAERSRYSLADAYVISSLAMQVIGNFYLQFHKPFLPTKIFNNEDAALGWLKQLDLH